MAGLSFVKIVGGGVAGIARAVTLPFGKVLGARTAAHAAAALAPKLKIATPRGTIVYRCPTGAVAKNAARMIAREPDTIAWIEECVRPGEHLWDIGANIGTFAIYACMKDGVTATAFEPEAGNYDVMVQAIIENGLGARVAPLAMGISDRTQLLTIHLATREAGSGLHALDTAANVRGSFDAAASVFVPAVRGDDAMSVFGIRAPDHIKIDVDGHEQQVLAGLGAALDHARTLWIEMTDFAEASGENGKLAATLAQHGFKESRLTNGPKGENRLYVKGRG